MRRSNFFAPDERVIRTALAPRWNGRSHCIQKDARQEASTLPGLEGHIRAAVHFRVTLERNDQFFFENLLNTEVSR